MLFEGPREIRCRLYGVDGRLATIKDRAETATRDLLLRVPPSFEGQVEVVVIRTKLLRETLNDTPMADR